MATTADRVDVLPGTQIPVVGVMFSLNLEQMVLVASNVGAILEQPQPQPQVNTDQGAK